MKANYPKGMGGAQNMNAMLQQAQKMQEEMAALQEELEAREWGPPEGWTTPPALCAPLFLAVDPY